MKSPDAAAEHLRTIRSLMERATVYRAISGPGALLGGVLALGVGGALLWKELEWQPSNLQFLAIWVAVLVVVGAGNFYLLYREARHRQEKFVSAGMKHALGAIVPPLLAGFVLSLGVAMQRESAMAEMAALWAVGYGLALLAAGSFAPRSMRVLGAVAFLMGLGLFIVAIKARPAEDYCLALRTMIGCFGALHLFYGFWVLLSTRRVPSSD